MEAALTVLLWVVAIAIGLWILSAIVGAIAAGLMLKKGKKEMDKVFSDDFYRKQGLNEPKRIRGRKIQ